MTVVSRFPRGTRHVLSVKREACVVGLNTVSTERAVFLPFGLPCLCLSVSVCLSVQVQLLQTSLLASACLPLPVCVPLPVCICLLAADKEVKLCASQGRARKRLACKAWLTRGDGTTPKRRQTKIIIIQRKRRRPRGCRGRKRRRKKGEPRAPSSLAPLLKDCSVRVADLCPLEPER